MRILVVEDHPDTLHWLQIHLEELGHIVITAATRQEGQALLADDECDVLISDIGLPDGNGWELLAETPPSGRLLAIAMSGAGRNADAERSYAAGYHYHLYKPFPLTYLDKLLEEATP